MSRPSAKRLAEIRETVKIVGEREYPMAADLLVELDALTARADAAEAALVRLWDAAADSVTTGAWRRLEAVLQTTDALADAQRREWTAKGMDVARELVAAYFVEGERYEHPVAVALGARAAALRGGK